LRALALGNSGILLLPLNSGAHKVGREPFFSSSGSIREANLREMAIESCDRVLPPSAQIPSAREVFLHRRSMTHWRAGMSAADVQSAIS
jgi:hypothetical protein